MAGVMHTEHNLSLERYVEVVPDARARGLPVKLGLEVDFQPGTEQRVLDLLAPYPWDFLIGSVHWLGAWEFRRFGAAAEFERRGVETAWRQYFALETQLAAAGMVDVLAHPDVIKRWGHRPAPEVIDELYRPVVAAAAASGVAIEVSSTGLRHPVAEMNPAPTFLAMFHEACVPITLASDAHVPDLCGFAHDKVVAAARVAGYDSYMRFSARARIETRLPERQHQEGGGIA
jgi:histidinol-phosphatase (PHP family)